MGGVGSGRQKSAARPRVEAHGVALRVGELGRWGGGALQPDAWGTLTWGAGDAPEAMVSFRTTCGEFIAMYHIGEGTERKLVAEYIPLARVRGGFGGMRTYFRCLGEGCNRRVEVLHLAKGRFRCRRCHGLVYESQYEDADHRAYRRANKLRGRLRYDPWRAFSPAPIVRPKGMWRRKFWRLQDAIDEADMNATAVCAMRLKTMADRMQNRDRRMRA